jgi:hypothetical protein
MDNRHTPFHMTSEDFNKLHHVRTSIHYVMVSLLCNIIGTLLQIIYGGHWWVLLLVGSLLAILSTGPALRLARLLAGVPFGGDKYE